MAPVFPFGAARVFLFLPAIIKKLIFQMLGLDKRKNETGFLPAFGRLESARYGRVFAPESHERSLIHGIQLARQLFKQFFHNVPRERIFVNSGLDFHSGQLERAPGKIKGDKRADNQRDAG